MVGMTVRIAAGVLVDRLAVSLDVQKVDNWVGLSVEMTVGVRVAYLVDKLDDLLAV